MKLDEAINYKVKAISRCDSVSLQDLDQSDVGKLTPSPITTKVMPVVENFPVIKSDESQGQNPPTSK